MEFDSLTLFRFHHHDSQGFSIMKRIGQLVSALLMGIVLSASSVQAQQYKYIGKLSFPVGTPGYLQKPGGIAVGADGTVFISDRTGVSTNSFDKFS